MRARLVLAFVCVATFLVYLDTSITPVAVPAIHADLGGGPSGAQWLLDAYTLTFACLLLTAGSLGDRLGRRPVLVLGVAGFTVASVLCATAPGLGVLIAARALQGAFAAVVVPLSLAVTSTLFAEPGRRAQAIGLWGGTSGVALALGPLLSGVLVQAAGWRSIFWINLPLGAIALAGLLAAMPPTARSGRRRVDIPGQLLFIGGAAAVTFVLIQGPADGWQSAPILGLAAGGVVALVAFALRQGRAGEPMVPPSLLRVPSVAIACVVNFLGLFGLYAAVYLLTTYLQGTQGLSPLQTGLRFLTLFGCLAVAAVRASAVAARLGTRRTMVLGLLAIAAGLAGLVLVPAGASYAGYAWALALLGVGVPLSSGVVAIQAMMGDVPPALSGTASGTMNTFRQLGAVLGVALAGILSPVSGGMVHSMPRTLIAAAGGALVAALATWIVLGRGSSRGREADRRPAEVTRTGGRSDGRAHDPAGQRAHGSG